MNKHVNKLRLSNVLCWLWNKYEGAKLPSVYFIANTKHCKTYLTLTQFFTVLLPSRLYIEKYTYYVEFWCISFWSLLYLAYPWMRSHGQMDFISSIFVRYFQNYLGSLSLIRLNRCIC